MTSPVPSLEVSFRMVFRPFFVLVTVGAGLVFGNGVEALTFGKTAGSQAVYTVPFRYDALRSPAITVNARLNNGPWRRFILDTGTNVAILLKRGLVKPTLAEAQKPAYYLGSARFVSTELQSFELEGLAPPPAGQTTSRSDPIPVRDVNALVGDLSSLLHAYQHEDIVGVIGAPVLSPCRVHFDFANRRLHITPNPPKAIDDALKTEVEERADGYHVAVKVGSSKAQMALIDTGSVRSGVFFVTNEALPGAVNPAVSMGVYQGHSALVATEKVLAPKVNIGGAELTDVVFFREPSAEDTTIGIDVLSRFDLTIDFVRRTALFKPVQVGPNSAPAGWTGITLARAGNAYKVKTVLSDSPAKRTNVQTGDVITSVDGNPLQNLAPRMAQRVLNGFAGTEAELRLTRNGSDRIIVRIPRKSEFGREPSALQGLCLARTGENPFYVRYSRLPSHEHNGSVQVGDAIISIDGVKTATMRPEEVEQVLTKTHLRLEILRKSKSTPVHLKLPFVRKTDSLQCMTNLTKMLNRGFAQTISF